MLNHVITGLCAASLAFCVYTAGWGAPPAVQVPAVAANESCCEMPGEMQPIVLLDVATTAPATAPASKAVDVNNTKCLISGEAVGSMGEGQTVEYKGKLYHFCCSDCVKTFNKDPDKYVKALEADPAKWGVKK